MTEAARNALILKFVRAGTPIEEAEAQADDILETLLAVEPEPTTVLRARGGNGTLIGEADLPEGWQLNADGKPVGLRTSDAGRAPVLVVPIQGPDGLTDRQRAARGTVGLCANCQQPNNAHLPGCAKEPANGLPAMDSRAVTKNPLSPVE